MIKRWFFIQLYFSSLYLLSADYSLYPGKIKGRPFGLGKPRSGKSVGFSRNGGLRFIKWEFRRKNTFLAIMYKSIATKCQDSSLIRS